MKEYHTKIKINMPIATVWSFLTYFEKYPDWNPLVGKLTGEIREGGTIETYIVPLGKSYYPTLLSYKIGAEIIWQGKQGATFIIAGKHYYKLTQLENNNSQEAEYQLCTILFFTFEGLLLLKS